MRGKAIRTLVEVLGPAISSLPPYARESMAPLLLEASGACILRPRHADVMMERH